MKAITCIIVGAGARGKDAYAQYIVKHPDKIKIVGVAEPNKEKRNGLRDMCCISEDMCFESYTELFKKPKLADCVLICTQDEDHVQPTLMAMEKEYHIFLEKPVSTNMNDILEIEKHAKAYHKLFMAGYVLRYTPFFMKMKELIDTGEIGKIISIQHNENEGFWHHAHSYVRGPWNNSETSSPYILAKSCHDIDLILYLTGADCTSVSSYGGNTYFNKGNAPEGCAKRCTDDCKYADTCKYNAITSYSNGESRYFLHILGCEGSKDALKEVLKTSPFGRCVYYCDNNVPDHQVVNMEMNDGSTVVFTVSAFTKNNSRTIKIMGTEGEIGGCLEEGIIILRKFSGDDKKYMITCDDTKHCGGDSAIINELIDRINEKRFGFDETIINSHVIAFASEASRIERRMVEVKKYKELNKISGGKYND